jgi:hypothetical protein
MKVSRLPLRFFLVALICLTLTIQFQVGAAQQAQRDANGNPIRTATRTGHVSNYDEAKVPPYTLPELLVAANGTRIQSADQWMKIRRPELLKLYETEIYGKVPANAPKVVWEDSGVTGSGTGVFVQKRVVGKVGNAADSPRINVTITTPAGAKGPVPIVLSVNFGGGAGGRGPISSGEPIPDIIARGWAHASVGYADIQPDSTAFTQGVIGQTLAAGQTAPAPDEWGTISAWAWGISRIIDYFETDKAIDARQVAIMGHSRLGKTVLWAGAQDPRVAVVFSSCAGEMGSSLARRDWGETVDDMAQNFAWQFAGNFQKWPGKWNDMPVDAHMLIALNAPHPVFITGGTTDQWADPKGEFLAAVAAGPVYRLLGKKDLGITELPALDTPVITGDLGWHYHTGGHSATPADWKAFLDFASKYLKARN